MRIFEHGDSFRNVFIKGEVKLRHKKTEIKKKGKKLLFTCDSDSLRNLLNIILMEGRSFQSGRPSVDTIIIS